MELTKYEMETIYNYNKEEEMATCYTCDKKLIKKLNSFLKKSNKIRVLSSDENSVTYELPKTWIGVRLPKQLSEETREALRANALKNLQGES